MLWLCENIEPTFTRAAVSQAILLLNLSQIGWSVYFELMVQTFSAGLSAGSTILMTFIVRRLACLDLENNARSMKATTIPENPQMTLNESLRG